MKVYARTCKLPCLYFVSKLLAKSSKFSYKPIETMLDILMQISMAAIETTPTLNGNI